MRKLFTSESVTEGHPDKVCDRISDAVLDAVLAKDSEGRVACETCCTTDTVFIAGEITSKVDVNIVGIARRVLRDIGYTGGASGFNANTCKIEVAVHKQSPDIAMGTGDDVGGAGDQGMMFGYACSETEQLMPLPIMLAHQMAYRLTQRRKDGTIPFILPDGKTQVTVEYGEDGMPSRIDTIVISTQHYENATEEQLLESLTENVITPILKYAKHFAGVYGGDLDIDTYNLYINPTGRFVQGGPAADTGLTGRKIIVDTYGGYAPHGGGAFSGKDPTKVDRSAAYMARYIAKNIVDAGICSRCQVQLAYAIGVAEPVSVRIDTFGGADEEKLVKAVRQCFGLTPNQIIEHRQFSANFRGIFFAVSKNLLESLPKVGNVLSFFFFLKDYPCFDLNLHEQEMIKEYHAFIRKRLRNKEDMYRREVVMGLMQGFFFELCNIFNSYAPDSSAVVKSKSRKEYIFERFYESLIQSYQSERSVKFYADQLCLTPKHLSGVVKEISGKTVGEWIDELVILEAKALLNSSSMNIQEIADRLNFANQSFFGKYFKHYTGMSPKEYRKSR